MDNWVDPVKDLVAFNCMYDDWGKFKQALKQGDVTAWAEFDMIISLVAREYSKQVERYYIEEND